MFEDYDDRNNSLFGLAFAQWETKSLDPTIYKQVKEIIETQRIKICNQNQIRTSHV